MKWLQKTYFAEKKVPMLLLLAVCVIEFLFIVLENRFAGIGYYLAEIYLIVPCLLFMGWMLREEKSPFAARRFLLACAAIAWFVIVQMIHRLSDMGNHPLGTVFFVYLMAFPFAALTDDRKNAGLWMVGSMFIASSLVLVLYSLLLVLGRVPAGLEAYLFWDGARLHPLWHPNVAAGYFMIGIGFSLVFCVLSRRKAAKALLLAAAVLQLMAMALTNCRTTLLLTGAMLGGTLFFLIFKGGWKRFLLGMLAAALVLAGSFKLSGMLYQWNINQLVASYYDEQETVTPEEEISYQEPAQLEEMTGEEALYAPESDVLEGENAQKSLLEDLLSFNNRIYIWEAALDVLLDSKPMMLWGTEYPGTVISSYVDHPIVHSHNSWMEVLMRMGIPGLAISLVFTALSVFCAAKLMLTPGTELWKKIVAMLAMCVMASGFLEPYLFITNVYYHVTDFTFFFLTGYLDCWCAGLRKPEPEI